MEGLTARAQLDEVISLVKSPEWKHFLKLKIEHINYNNKYG